jgi:DNA mismatch endonuclease (patch repair protein)
MSRIRGKNTTPEVCLRKALFARGLRYRLHSVGLPGKPDIVFPRHRAVVFVNGCFWHGHNCRLFKWPRGNAKFWRKKILGNRTRDKLVRTTLRGQGWRCATVWECRIRRSPQERFAEVAQALHEWLASSAPSRTIS